MRRIQCACKLYTICIQSDLLLAVYELYAPKSISLSAPGSYAPIRVICQIVYNSYTNCIQFAYNSHSPKHVFSCDSFKITPLERCTCHLGNSPNHQILYELYTIRIRFGTSTRNCIRIVYNSAFVPIVYKLYTIGRFLTPPCIQFLYKLYKNCIRIV